MSWDFSTNQPQQGFGWRTRNGGEWHFGRDYGTRGKQNVPLGVPKYCDGWVCQVLPNNKKDGLGNQIILVSPDGKEMVRFGHVSSGSFNHLKTGQILHTGDWIGNIGGVGVGEHSFKPRIHIEHGYNPHFGLARVNQGRDIVNAWYCGDNKIEDYRDPNLTALPYTELEGLTDMAAQSREAILLGRGRTPEMSDKTPAQLVSGGGEKENPLVDWLKTSWLGRLFFSTESGPSSNTAPANVENPNHEDGKPRIFRKGDMNFSATQSQREDMKKAGFTDEAIQKFDDYIQEQRNKGLLNTLGQNSVRVNFDKLYEGNKEMADVARRYFAENQDYKQR